MADRWVTVPPASRDSLRPVRADRLWSTRDWWRDGSRASGWVVLLAVTALWVSDGGLQEFTSVADGLVSLGRITGLIASALLLIQVFLMARVPWVEQAWGQDELTRVHRRVGFSSFSLMLAHIALITVGYAATRPALVWPTLVDFAVDYPGMLLALAGTAALIMVVVTSMRVARRRLRYESWHLIHLYGYLGAGLVLPHQLWVGQDFKESSPATIFWWTLYAVCAVSVLIFRVVLPVWRSLRVPLRVVHAHRENNVVTVVIGGPGVPALHARGGQYFQWRFLDGPGWSRAHPFSLSAAPTASTLRFTAAVVGDGTARLELLRPGTRVLVEGPYGRMHSGTRTRQKVLLLGAGIGITPMRALLESLPQSPGDVMIINRARSIGELVLDHEIDDLAAIRGAHYERVVGRRVTGRNSWLPDHAAAWDDATALLHLCPDLGNRDVYLCGPGAWLESACRAVQRAGVAPRHIHVEHFTL